MTAQAMANSPTMAGSPHIDDATRQLPPRPTRPRTMPKKDAGTNVRVDMGVSVQAAEPLPAVVTNPAHATLWRLGRKHSVVLDYVKKLASATPHIFSRRYSGRDGPTFT